VIQAPLGPVERTAVKPAYAWIDRGIALLMLALLVLTSFDPPIALAGPWISPVSLTRACVAGLWGVILLGICSLLVHARAEVGHPDAASLALLLELARTWPRSHSDRAETILALVGGQELDRTGDYALWEIEKAEWPLRPTLTIIVVAPGRGKELLVVGSEVVQEAADGLWVPNRHGILAEVPQHVRPIGRMDGETAVLAGADWNQRPPPEIDPQALGRTAQVIREAALRWGRQHEGQDAQPPDDRSEARSSQNPG
jgi:hypothetical protein